MKKFIGTVLVITMMVFNILPVSALTNYKPDRYQPNFNDATGGEAVKNKDNANVITLKGTPGTSSYNGMDVGPYIKTSSKITDKGGIHEVLYVDHSTLKGTELFQISYQIGKGENYANEVDTITQRGNDGKIRVSLSGITDFGVELPDNGIYKYDFKSYVGSDDAVKVEFSVYDSTDKLIGSSKELDLNQKFTYERTEVSKTDDVTLNAIWFCNIKVADGVNVYSLADDVVVDTNEATDEEKHVQDVLKQALANSDLAEKTKFINAKVEVEMSKTATNEQEVNEIKTKADSLLKNIKVSNYFDIAIAVRNKANNNLIGNLAELSEPIELKVDIPEQVEAVKEGYTRKYYIIRNHNGEVKLLDTKVSEDGKSLTFETDQFSTYAIGYTDNKVASNPNTYDGITTYLVIGTIATLTIGLVSLYLNKRKSFN